VHCRVPWYRVVDFLRSGLCCCTESGGASFGQWEISIIWGLGVAMAIYLTAGVSGAHLNPAVTIALWLFACFDGRKVVPFILSQFAGAFCAAALFTGFITIFSSTFRRIIWCAAASKVWIWQHLLNLPNPHINFVQAFAVEMVITAILMGVIIAGLTTMETAFRVARWPAADWPADCGYWCIHGPADRVCDEPGVISDRKRSPLSQAGATSPLPVAKIFLTSWYRCLGQLSGHRWVRSAIAN
jgi:glycerol uptake facilitator-like aquaporin